MIKKLEELRSEYDIVIVGAGIAGLGLSRLLNTENKKVLIIHPSNLPKDKGFVNQLQKKLLEKNYLEISLKRLLLLGL